MKLLMEPSVAKWAIIVVLAVLSVWTLILCSKPLRDAGLKSIIAFETVMNPGDAKALWQTVGFCGSAKPPAERRKALLTHLEMDTWFICCYAPLFCLLCWCAGDAWSHLWPAAPTFARWLAAAQLLAGVLDLVENHGLRQIVVTNTLQPATLMIAGAASRLKWAILLVGACWLVIGLVLAVIHRARTNRGHPGA